MMLKLMLMLMLILMLILMRYTSIKHKNMDEDVMMVSKEVVRNVFEVLELLVMMEVFVGLVLLSMLAVLGCLLLCGCRGIRGPVIFVEE